MRPVFEYIKNFCIVILFAWISFFPQPVQDHYWIYASIFLSFFLILLISNREYRSNLFSSSDWPLYVFLASLSAGIINAQDKGLASRTLLYLITTFFLLFYIGKAIYRYLKDRNLITKVICICASLVALFALLELYFSRNILYERYIPNPFYVRFAFSFPRPMSSLLHPTILGSFLLACLPFSLSLLNKKLLHLRITGIFLSLLFVVLIVRAYSRGVFLGLVVLLSFYLWTTRRRRSLLIFGALTILFISVCSYQNGLGLSRFGLKGLILGSFDSVISKYRTDRFQTSVKMLKDYPLSGVGLNHFRIRFDEYKPKDGVSSDYEFKIPDNMYLSFLAETGIIGMTGLFIFILALLRRSILYLKKNAGPDKRQVLLMPMFALIGLLVNMGGYDLFYWATPYMLFSLFCGFIQSSVYDI